jgi:hypothetical protein
MMRRWQPIHTIGAILTIVGVGIIFGTWYVAVDTKGVLLSSTGAVGGPLSLAHGVSMLAFPRVWSGPDGNEMAPGGRAEGIIGGLGLLFGITDLLILEAVFR